MRARMFLHVALTALGSVVLVLLIGVLAIRRQAVAQGFVLDVFTAPTGLTVPTAPWLPSLGIVILVAASVLAVWPRGSWAGSHPWLRRALPAIVCGTVLLAFAVAFFIAVGVTVAEPRGSSAGWSILQTAFYGPAAQPTVLAWLRAGALSPATHAVIGVCAASLLLSARRMRGRRAPGEHADPLA